MLHVPPLPPCFTFCFGNIYTTACTGSSEFISFIGQANNGVACLSHVQSGAPRMRIDIQKADHATVSNLTLDGKFCLRDDKNAVFV